MTADDVGTPKVRRAEKTGESDAGITDIGAILDTVDIPIVVVDRDCRLARFNQAATSALGLTPSDIGRLPGNIRALAEVQDFEKLCAEVIADGAPCRREIRKGDRRFVVRVAPHAGSDRQVTGVVLTFTNVTAFRASLEKAIYEREHTKAILNTVIEPLVVLDSDLRLQTANRAFYAMFGVSREETQGIPLYNLGNDEWTTSGVWSLLRASLADHGEFPTTELERDFPMVGRRTVLLDARRFSPDGDARRMMLLAFRDITERKRASEQARDAEQQLRDFVENASVGMHCVGPDGIILWANRTELEMLGYTQEEYIGHHIAEFHADQRVIGDILTRLTDGETLQDYEARLRCKDGSVRNGLINANVLWEQGKFIHTRCFTRDVTERNKADEALRESRASVERLLVSAEHARAEAERANRAKDEFLAVLSHELRSPLNAMLGWVQILKRAGSTDALIGRAVETLERNVLAQSQVINDLLDISRITSGKLALERSRVDLAAVVAGVVESMRPMAEGQHLELLLTMSHERLEVEGDGARLQQVLGNLVHNAIKFTPEGGTVSVRASTGRGEAVVVIEDTGQGIEGHILPRIFGRFVQSESSTTRRHGGLGLGLAIVQQLISLHGGSVQAESAGLGRGARFTVCLPLALPLAREVEVIAAVVPKAERADMRALDVLLVEDDADSREALALAIEQTGAHVRLADSARLALEIYSDRPPDILVSDIGMPGEDGYSLIRTIREREEGSSRRTLAIAMTGFASRQDHETALRAGFDEHVGKPVEPGALLDRMRVLAAARGSLGAARRGRRTE